MTGTDRRGFLRALALRAVDGAATLASATATGAASALDTVSAERAASADGASAVHTPGADGSRAPVASLRTPARQPDRCLGVAEVHEIAAAEGLRLPSERLGALIRRSVRLTEADDVPGAWLVVPGAIAQQGRLGAGAEIVLRVDRAALALAGSPLAGDEVLTITIAGTPAPERTVGGSHRVDVRLGADERHDLRPGAEWGRPLRLDAHLQLPRVWSDAMQGLDLDEQDTAAYIRVRDRLAEAQGLELDQGAHSGIALHRMLGYPDDTSGTMPGECTAFAAHDAVSTVADVPAFDPGSIATADADPDTWRLLLQLSLGPASRLFVWSSTASDAVDPTAGARQIGLLR